MSSWIAAYNTNGFAHHRLFDAVNIIAELGYGGLALTLDVHHLDPFADNHHQACLDFRAQTEELGLPVIIESGARFNLDPVRKHYPSLLCKKDGRQRIDYLLRCHETALAVGADIVTLWSGHDFERLGYDRAFDLLVENMGEVLDRSRGSGVRFGFEPEPGMLIETLDQYDQLAAAIDRPNFGLALDLGHLLVTGECSPAEAILDRAGQVLCFAIEDMKRGVHEHLPFGQGDMDLPAICAALKASAFEGIVSVELSRSSSDAVRIASESLHVLSDLRSKS